MKQIQNKWILLSFFLLLLISCFEDKGNYNYEEINEILISGLKNEVRYSMKDSLIVRPGILYTLNPGGSYTYQWTAQQADAPLGTTPPEIIIGNEKDLHYYVELPQGRYYIKLTATDVNTTLLWTGLFELTVATSTSTGWMILCNDKGRSRLDMVEESSDERLISYDILASTPLPVHRKPLNIKSITVDYMQDEIFVLTEEGCSKLVSKDLSWEEANDFRYLMADPSMGDVVPTDFVVSPINGTLLLASGNAYWRKHQGSALFGRPVNYMNGQRIHLAPSIATQIGYSTFEGVQNFVLYDTVNQQFIRYAPNDTRCSVIDDFPKGYQLITLQNSTYDRGTSYAVLEDRANGKYYLFPFYASDLISAGELTELNIPDIEKVSHFAFDPVYPYMFYAIEDKLWLYSYTEDLPYNQNTKMYVDLNNEKITLLKYDINSIKERYLMVGTVSTAGEGSMRLFEAQPVRGTVVLYEDPYTGFAQIVDATYKEK